MSNECCCAAHGGSSVTAQRQCAWVQINWLPTHPTPARSVLLRGLCESSTIALSRWDKVSVEVYSYSHSSFQTKALYPATFPLSDSKSWRREHRPLHVKTHLNRMGAEQAHSGGRNHCRERMEIVTQSGHQQHPSLYIHLCAQIAPSSRAGSTTHHWNHSIHHMLRISFLLLTALLHGNHLGVCSPY